LRARRHPCVAAPFVGARTSFAVWRRCTSLKSWETTTARDLRRCASGKDTHGRKKRGNARAGTSSAPRDILLLPRCLPFWLGVFADFMCSAQGCFCSRIPRKARRVSTSASLHLVWTSRFLVLPFILPSPLPPYLSTFSNALEALRQVADPKQLRSMARSLYEKFLGASASSPLAMTYAGPEARRRLKDAIRKVTAKTVVSKPVPSPTGASSVAIRASHAELDAVLDEIAGNCRAALEHGSFVDFVRHAATVATVKQVRLHCSSRRFHWGFRVFFAVFVNFRALTRLDLNQFRSKRPRRGATWSRWPPNGS
jgi:hypothetical protein